MNGLKIFSLCSVIVTMVFLVSLTVAYSNERNDNITYARVEYQKGTKYFDTEEWFAAYHHFKKSYDAVPDPQTAYLLSCIFLELDDADPAIEWATVALEGRPSLNDPYKKGAKDIIAWAEEKKQKNRPSPPRNFSVTTF